MHGAHLNLTDLCACCSMLETWPVQLRYVWFTIADAKSVIHSYPSVKWAEANSIHMAYLRFVIGSTWDWTYDLSMSGKCFLSTALPSHTYHHHRKQPTILCRHKHNWYNFRFHEIKIVKFVTKTTFPSNVQCAKITCTININGYLDEIGCIRLEVRYLEG